MHQQERDDLYTRFRLRERSAQMEILRLALEDLARSDPNAAYALIRVVCDEAAAKDVAEELGTAKGTVIKAKQRALDYLLARIWQLVEE